MANNKSTKNKLLIIEDNPDFRNDLEKKLKRRNFNVDAVGSRGEAELHIMKNTYEIAVIDIDLEDKEKLAGLLVAQKLIQMDKYVKIIIMTAHSHVPLAVLAAKIGAYSFVSKADGDDTLGAVKDFWHNFFDEIEMALERRRLDLLDEEIDQEITTLLMGLDKTRNDLKKLQARKAELEKSEQRYRNRNMLIENDDMEKYRKLIR